MKIIARILVYIFGQTPVRVFFFRLSSRIYNIGEIASCISFTDSYNHQLQQAEAWLNQKQGVIWPWNTERDKRTPKASLPGADLIGFIEVENETRLVLGEIKASSDVSTPPNVMNGRGGMVHQLETLATDLKILSQLLRYLQPRCKNSPHEDQFNAAVTLLFKSGNKAIALFGVLIRDTAPAENDLKSRAQHLAKQINSPSTCHLQALYLPHAISDLPHLVSCGAQS